MGWSLAHSSDYSANRRCQQLRRQHLLHTLFHALNQKAARDDGIQRGISVPQEVMPQELGPRKGEINLWSKGNGGTSQGRTVVTGVVRALERVGHKSWKGNTC